MHFLSSYSKSSASLLVTILWHLTTIDGYNAYQQIKSPNIAITTYILRQISSVIRHIGYWKSVYFFQVHSYKTIENGNGNVQTLHTSGSHKQSTSRFPLYFSFFTLLNSSHISCGVGAWCNTNTMGATYLILRTNVSVLYTSLYSTLAISHNGLHTSCST